MSAADLRPEEREALALEIERLLATEYDGQGALAAKLGITQQAVSRAVRHRRAGRDVADAVCALSKTTLRRLVEAHHKAAPVKRYPNLERALTVLRESRALTPEAQQIAESLALQSPRDLALRTWLDLLEQLSAAPTEPVRDDELPPPPAARR